MEFLNIGLLIITGPMYSGKSLSLNIMLSEYRDIGLKVLKIVNSCDTRTNECKNSSFPNLTNIDIRRLNTFENFNLDIDYHVIAIDEAQFFDISIIEFVKKHMTNSFIIVSGLNGTFNREKFGFISDLISLATDIIFKKSFCKFCDKDIYNKTAVYTMKINGDKNKLIEIGANEIYLPVCIKHFN